MSDATVMAGRLIVLEQDDWSERERRHLERVEYFVGPHEQRARIGQAHPVWDFLFTYYSLRPRQLKRWHPGFGVGLRGARHFHGRSGYDVVIDDVVAVTDAHLAGRLETVAYVAQLLAATASRPARLNCFGLHEWAMVYRSPDVRHSQVPLRLGTAGTDAVVESMPLRCSHFDAYRFFTDAAISRNSEQLSRERQSADEQPGCLHAGMDLYKWSYKLAPFVESDLLMDCLDLAAEARMLDMRASPYDLSEYGVVPITIEDAGGRAEYVRLQQDIAQRAMPLRATLLSRCESLLAHGGLR